jgi:hypothetical protein
MCEQKVPVQSLIDHIKTAVDVDPWAKEMAEELLKEQEPVKQERQHSGGGTTWWNVCGNCRTAINPNDKYCHECGRKVKWG